MGQEGYICHFLRGPCLVQGRMWATSVLNQKKPAMAECREQHEENIWRVGRHYCCSSLVYLRDHLRLLCLFIPYFKCRFSACKRVVTGALWPNCLMTDYSLRKKRLRKREMCFCLNYMMVPFFLENWVTNTTSTLSPGKDVTSHVGGGRVLPS